VNTLGLILILLVGLAVLYANRHIVDKI